MKYMDINQVQKKMNTRIIKNNILKYIFFIATTFGLIVLAVLLLRVITQGIGFIDINFLTSKLSTDANRAGIMGAILGTCGLWLLSFQ